MAEQGESSLEREVAKRYEDRGWDPVWQKQGLGSGDYEMGGPGARARWEVKHVTTPNAKRMVNRLAVANRQAENAKKAGKEPVTRVILDTTHGGHSVEATRQGFDRFLRRNSERNIETMLTQADLWGLGKNKQAELASLSQKQVQNRIAELGNRQAKAPTVKPTQVGTRPGANIGKVAPKVAPARIGPRPGVDAGKVAPKVSPAHVTRGRSPQPGQRAPAPRVTPAKPSPPLPNPSGPKGPSGGKKH